MTEHEFQVALRATRWARVRMANEILATIRHLQKNGEVGDQAPVKMFTNMLVEATADDREDLDLPPIEG